MPCDQIRTVAVELTKCDPPTMQAALESLALSPRIQGTVIHFGNREFIDTATGKAQLASFRDVNEIKRAYSTAIVERTAKRYGWTVNKTAQNKFQLQKR